MDEVLRAEIENRLENWGAWARSGSGGHGACGSAERRYVPPRDDDNTRAERQAREPIMVVDAELIEQAVLGVGRRNPTARKLLVMRYVEQAPIMAMAKSLNVRPMLVEPYVLSAQGAVLGQIDLLKRSSRGDGWLRARRADRICTEGYPLNAEPAP